MDVEPLLQERARVREDQVRRRGTDDDEIHVGRGESRGLQRAPRRVFGQ
jgi:hypothetical protein